MDMDMNTSSTTTTTTTTTASSDNNSSPASNDKLVIKMNHKEYMEFLEDFDLKCDPRFEVWIDRN